MLLVANRKIIKRGTKFNAKGIKNFLAEYSTRGGAKALWCFEEVLWTRRPRQQIIIVVVVVDASSSSWWHHSSQSLRKIVVIKRILNHDDEGWISGLSASGYAEICGKSVR